MKRALVIVLLGLVASEAVAQTYPYTPLVVRRGRYTSIIRVPNGLYGTPAGASMMSVAGPPRLDFATAAPPGMVADIPKAGPGGFAAAREGSYQLIAPPVTAAGRSIGLLLFVGSPSQAEVTALAAACRKLGLALAVPVGVGDDVHAGLRLKRAVAVFDDVRRRLPLDTDRVYVGGLSGGAKTASQIAFTWPEMCGGLLAIGGTISQRAEPYLRERVRKRLTVVLMSGQLDPARHELERCRKPALDAAGVKVKLISVPGTARGLPTSGVLEQGLMHLELGKLDRAQLAKEWPATRIADGAVPSADAWSKALLDEAKKRLRVPGNVEGLMILHGITQRWPMEAAAQEAKKLLADHDRKLPRKWAEHYNRVQFTHYLNEASALDGYYRLMVGIPAGAPLVAPLREDLIQCWEQVANFGPETRQGKKAKARVAELKKVPAGR
jgi:pimeloyl-ACP methyl ester carboxylesterase